MERSLETRVSQAIDAWLAWLPRWQPATHRGRRSPCPRCYGSPLLRVLGVADTAPHGVQHALSVRFSTIIDQRVAHYTEQNLPLLQAELEQQAARNRSRSYRPTEGLDPEFEGLPLDPDPEPGAPFLFTIAGLAEEAAQSQEPLPPLSEAEKQALRREIALSDDYANEVGHEVCVLLSAHRDRVQAAIREYVDPQIDDLLRELTRSLDDPFDPRSM